MNLRPAEPRPIYETDKILSEYLLFHYGTAEEILPFPFGPRDALDYAVRSVTALINPEPLPAWGGRALDLGCAVGRSAFELARYCDSVTGIDFSHAFIAAANHIKESGCLEYKRLVSGEKTETLWACAPDGIDRSRVHFEVGDAMHLRSDIGSFDVVHMANLIDRLGDPRLCLDRLPELIPAGGQLLLSSPYTWMEEFTPREKWIGRTGNDWASTLEGLQEILEPNFSLDKTSDLPFFIREHERKYQWSVAQGTRWIRRG